MPNAVFLAYLELRKYVIIQLLSIGPPPPIPGPPLSMAGGPPPMMASAPAKVEGMVKPPATVMVSLIFPSLIASK